LGLLGFLGSLGLLGLSGYLSFEACRQIPSHPPLLKGGEGGLSGKWITASLSLLGSLGFLGLLGYSDSLTSTFMLSLFYLVHWRVSPYLPIPLSPDLPIPPSPHSNLLCLLRWDLHQAGFQTPEEVLMGAANLREPVQLLLRDIIP